MKTVSYVVGGLLVAALLLLTLNAASAFVSMLLVTGLAIFAPISVGAGWIMFKLQRRKITRLKREADELRLSRDVSFNDYTLAPAAKASLLLSRGP